MLPSRSKLGSSSTFSVGMFHALYASKGAQISKKLALSAINLSKYYWRIGRLPDQTAAAFGGFNLIKFNKKSTIEMNTLKLKKKD